MGPHLS